MNLTLPAADLAGALSRLAHIVEKRTLIPILTNVRIEAGGGTVTLAATNLDVSASIVLPAGITAEGATAVDAARLAAFLAGLPKEAEALLRLDGATLKALSGRRSAQLPTLPAEDFPPVGDFAADTECHLDATAMKRLVAVNTACSDEETRYYFNGVHLASCEGNIVATATDGHRLMRATMIVEGAPEIPPARSIIVPKETVGHLARLFPEGCRLELNERRLRAASDGIVLVSKLIDGTFPDADRVIPRPSDKLTIEANAADLARAAQSVAAVSGETAVRLEPEGGRLVIRNSQGVEAEDAIEAVCSGAGPVGINARYLAGIALALECETVRLSQADPGSPVRVDPIGVTDRLAVIMPMRV